MEKLLISILLTTCVSNSLQSLNEPLSSASGAAVKRDISFSYAATDIGSLEGTHVKTLTIIKNIANNSKNKVDSVVNLRETGDSNKDKDESSKIEVPDIPQIPELSEFDIFLTHEYVPKSDDNNENDKMEISSELDKNEENVKISIDSKREELANDGIIAGDGLLNTNAEEINETNENIKSEKLKPSDETVFISSPILPEQAKRSAKAQKERYHAKLVKSNDQATEILHPEANIEKHYENVSSDKSFEKIFEPSNEKKSEPLIQLPISFDGIPPPFSDKTVFPTKSAYSKKSYQINASGLGYKRNGIFIPKFVTNFKPIKK